MLTVLIMKNMLQDAVKTEENQKVQSIEQEVANMKR
jgi:hypothetical protein